MFDPGDGGFVADSGIEADSRAYGKAPSRIIISEYADIDIAVVLRIHDIVKSLFCVRRKTKPPGKIIA